MPPAPSSPSPLHSMTGFAQVRAEHGGVELRVTLKSVNHRFLDLRWQVPSDLEPLLPELERRLRRRVLRGHIDVRLALEPRAAAASAARLNRDLVDAYLQGFAELSARLPPAGQGRPAPFIRPADILRLPGVLALAADVPAPPEAFVTETFDAALEAFLRMRATEGEALARDLHARLDRFDAARAALAALRAPLEAALLDRLRRRLQEILSGAAAAVVDPARLAQEAALLAERSDVSEELARIEAHTAQARALLVAGGEAGKKLDFLTQELNREVNTLLSKTASAAPAALATTDGGLQLKAELEKFREQIQNLE